MSQVKSKVGGMKNEKVTSEVLFCIPSICVCSRLPWFLSYCLNFVRASVFGSGDGNRGWGTSRLAICANLRRACTNWLPLQASLQASLNLVSVRCALEDGAKFFTDVEDVLEVGKCDAGLDDVVAKAVLEHQVQGFLRDVVHFHQQCVLRFGG